jgi:hypothetical protein
MADFTQDNLLAFAINARLAADPSFRTKLINLVLEPTIMSAPKTVVAKVVVTRKKIKNRKSPKPMTVEQLILSLKGQRVTAASAVKTIKKSLGITVKVQSIRATLSRFHQENRVKRLARGVYQL